MLFAMLAMASYSTVDGIFVSIKLGDDAMKAIVATWPIFPTLMAFALMFALGGASLISYYLAKGKKELACRIFSSICYLLFPFSLVLGILCYFNADSLVELLVKNLSSEVKAMAIEYLKGVCVGLFGIIMHPILDICVVNDKRPRFAMFAMFLGAACNVILNYLFLFVFEFGIVGSAWATILGHIIGSLVLVIHYIPSEIRVKIATFFGTRLCNFLESKSTLLTKKGDLCFTRTFSWRLIFRSAKLGIPYASSEASVGFVMWLYNATLKGIGGESALAIYSAILYAGFNYFTILLALAESIQPIASFNYGMRNFTRLRAILRFYIVAELLISIALYGIFFIFSEYIAAAFLKDMSLKTQSAAAMSVYFFGFIFLGINLIIALYLQSLQRALASFIVTMSYTLIFIVILLPLMARLLGFDGAIMAYPISQILALVTSVAVLYRVSNNYKV
ncbi:hypothetical protein DCO58_06760 [Helicobacter saguini]|uniref:MATE family efflux transporter n=2 Tax=Helicobacter saguini TaxID=1548018 RepID=A0A347VTQ8_9HELI|nr:hypothetical protein [Helicobacter saguini]MWV67359.1 hypothetical protein [Helicobacter saguini]MWV69712.1 hypothetical protein [Helicobacter saguini]MWV73071.1 hypothetical protein [Helicobacter saguini]TLD95695.1 hypothetical protein LS64_001480 [Helicobacter saguini]